MTIDRVTESVRLVDELCRRYRNWGRWGDADEKGALNFVGPVELRHAATLVRSGRVISCVLPFDERGPQGGRFGGRTNPVHVMLQDGGDIAVGAQDDLDLLRYTDDAVSMPLQCGTQWDALAHIFYRGQMYNGLGPEYVTSRGAARNGIDKIADGICGRGVLLDVPRHRGVPWLSAGEGILGDELRTTAREQGVEIRRGDIVLVRTGALAEVRANGSWGTYEAGPAPGLALDACHWFVEHEIAAYAADTWGTEVAAERHTGCLPAAAPDPVGKRGGTHRRDVRPRTARRGLRRGRALRIPACRAPAADHRCGRFPGQPAGHPVNGRS